MPIEAVDLEPIVRDAQFATLEPEDQEAAKREANEVKKIWDEYESARGFDQGARSQYAIDRRYAAGTADPTWAVTTNLIGCFIDILTSFLYARNPDVSVKKAPQVDNRGTKQLDDFAKTLELVITRLWRKGKLKPRARKQVRSALSVGPGYLKCMLIAEAPENPEMQRKVADLRDNIARLDAIQKNLSEIENASTEQADVEIQQQQEQLDALNAKVEAQIIKLFAIDFVPAQDFQCSLDVASTEDHLDSNWNANAIYVLKDELKVKFPRLTEEEVKSAAVYYQRKTKTNTPLTDQIAMSPGLGGGVAADEAEQFSKGSLTSSSAIGIGTPATADSGPAFAKVIELWDHRGDNIKTMVDGVKRWAKEPYAPPYASSRFYPYFRLAFFEVDGERHPQSLSQRLSKLQDEYSRSRSSWRLMRERAIPATLFDATNVTKEDMRKIENSTHQEFIGITPLNAERALSDNFAPKAYEHVDPRMFDNQPILADMEKISGVQEALQTSATAPKTATEAEIQQSGFASRTTADRDMLEDMLTELATYTAEQAIQCLTTQDAQRIAGPGAYWPTGMSIDDLFTMVEVEIKAGTTGKPGAEQDQQAWGVLLPVLKDTILQISQLIAAGDLNSARSLSELVRRTMTIMGDNTDPELLIPEIPDIDPVTGLPVGSPPALDPASNLPPSQGVDTGAGGEPAPGEFTNPELAAPELEAPTF